MAPATCRTRVQLKGRCGSDLVRWSRASHRQPSRSGLAAWQPARPTADQYPRSTATEIEPRAPRATPEGLPSRHLTWPHAVTAAGVRWRWRARRTCTRARRKRKTALQRWCVWGGAVPENSSAPWSPSAGSLYCHQNTHTQTHTFRPKLSTVEMGERHRISAPGE